MAKAKEEITAVKLCDDKDFSQIEAGVRYAFSRPSTAAKATIAFLDKLRASGGGGAVTVDNSAVEELKAEFDQAIIMVAERTSKKSEELEAKISAMEVTIAELQVELTKLKKA